MVRGLYVVLRVAVTVSLVVSLGLIRWTATHAASTLTVTTTADSLAPCAPASMSLRCAISQANTDGSGDTIAFNIPTASPGCAGAPAVCTIKPVAALPNLTASNTTIDGFSQPGAHPNTNSLPAGINAVITVQLDGSSAGNGVDGLTLSGSNNVVLGLSITGFRFASDPTGHITGGNGVALLGPGSTVQGNFIGVTPNGLSPAPNQFAGVNVLSPVGQETIGSPAPAAANVLSGNRSCSFGDCMGFGVYVNTGSGTTIAGNAIGTSASGAVAVGNAATGIVILSPGNTLGGTVSGAGNVISANGGDGADVDSANNVVAGNFIGTNAAGTAKMGNGIAGLSVQGGSNQIIRNVVSGNGATGIALNTSGNIVQGNRIGTNAAGTAALGNGFGSTATYNGDQGLNVCNTGNTIGGATATTGNLISGNHGAGIGLGSSNNVVTGNRIGTNAGGTAALGNGSDGIRLIGFCSGAPSIGGSGNTVGGTTSGSGNVISGNSGNGITLIAAKSNQIMGNRIGTNAAGTAAVANHGDGIFLTAFCDDGRCTPSSNNSIGGSQIGAGNIIGGNLANGVRIDGTGLGVSNPIQGNRIGTDQSGTASLGNHANGVFLLNKAVDDSVGGTVAGAGNIIAHNTLSGVLVGGSSADASHSPIQQNKLFDNGGPGIDLAPPGTVNCSTSPPGPNDYTACPIITAASVTQLSGTGCAGCTIEVFVATIDANDQGHGEGSAFLGRATASSTGAWTLNLAAGKVTSGQRVTATATTQVSFSKSAETSEFAANVVVS
jgi:parallel beta-helix repeat protein